MQKYYVWRQTIKAKDIVIFLRQFAILIEAGIPIVQACDTLANNQTKTVMHHLIYALKNDLQAGYSLFESVMQFSKHFDLITCHMIRLGEETGKLSKLLLTIADHHEMTQQRQKKLQQMMFYPLIVLIAAGCVCITLLVFVIPHFADLFTNTHLKLPLMTRYIFQLSKLFINYGFYILTITLMLIFVLYKQYSSFFYHAILKLPVLNNLVRKIFLAKFARSLSLTLSEGLPLHSALEYALNASGSPTQENILYKLQEALNSGLQLWQSLDTLPNISSLFVQMVKVGEETGKLPMILLKTANYLEAEVDHILHQMCTLFEPLIILVLGVVIGGLVISMYLPIFNLGSTI